MNHANRLCRPLVSLLLIVSAANSYALFCPTNFNQINTGDTIDQVTQQCGKPDKQETKEEKAPMPQEWTYLIPQSVPMSTNQMGQGTLKTTVDFNQEGKAINISVNGIGVGETTICGTAIRLGSDRDAVKAACGEPAFMNNEQPTNAETPATSKITTFYYNTNPPQTLVFENGVLK